MSVGQCFDEKELGRLLPKLGEVKDTVWRTLSLQGFEPPTASIVTRILFLVTMILKPFQSLWTVCFHLIFLVEPEDCPGAPARERRRKKPHLLLHCPHCWEPMHSRGTNGRTPVFFCPRHGRVSMRRTLEARVFFALYAIRVGQLVAAGIPEKDVAELLGVTRTFVETAVRTLAARLDLPAPRLKGDLVVLFLDGFYGSRIAVLVGKAGRHVLWTFGEENTLTIRSLLERIRKSLPEGATLVVVTDGKADYIDPVRSVFPDCIHVRHFHKTWDEVIVHYPLRGRVYSLHGPIDMLQRRKKARVTVWEGVRVNPPRPRKAEVVLSGEPGKLLSVIGSINASEKYDGRLPAALHPPPPPPRRPSEQRGGREEDRHGSTQAPQDEEAPPPLQETAPRQNRGVPRRHPEARREEAQRGQKTLCEKEKLHPDLQGHPGGGRGARRGREAPRENPEHRLQGRKAGQQPRWRASTPTSNPSYPPSRRRSPR